MLETWRLTLISEIKSIMQGNSNYEGLCFFLGAGADIASGGVLFSDLKKRCLSLQGINLPETPSLLDIDIAFDSYFTSLDEESRCAVLASLLRETRTLQPSDGYKLLVLLARERCISSIITTNFDNLLETTATEMGIDTFQIFAPGVSIPATFLINRKPQKAIYLKMHGDVDGRCVTHLTRKELQDREYEKEYRQLFQYLLVHDIIVVAGYSGYDQKIADIFSESIDSIHTVYWCNPSTPDQDAPLVRVLSDAGKMQYIPCGFDNFIEDIAGEVFKERMIFRADSIFIWSLIKAKVAKLQDTYLKNLPIRSAASVIDRRPALEQYDQFLAQNIHNMFVLIGNQGVGKSAFITKILRRNEYDNIYVVPITAPGSLTPNASAYLVENLGYVTANPMIVLYQMAEWLRENQRYMVFVFDAIENSHPGKEQISKYLSIIIELAYILRHVPNMKFMLSIREEIWKSVSQSLDRNYLQDILWTENDSYGLSTFHLDIFTIDELLDAIQREQQNFDEEELISLPESIQLILREPYFCDLALRTNSLKLISTGGAIGLIPAISRFLETQELTIGDKQALQRLAGKMLLKNSAYISIMDCDYQILPIDNPILEISEDTVSFRHPLFWEYFMIRYFKLQQLCDCVRQPVLNQIIDLFLAPETNTYIYESFVLYLSSQDESIDQICRFLIALSRQTKSNRYSSLRINQLTGRIVENWAINRETELLEWVKYVEKQNESFQFLSKRLVYASTYMEDKAAYQFLDLLRRNCQSHISLECYVLINDRFSAGLQQVPAGHEKEYIQEYGRFLKTSNPLNDLVQLLWLMGKIGPDNTSPERYDRIAACVKSQLIANNQGTLKKQYVTELKESFLRNAYMIFFNANSNLEEKYYCFSSKSKTAPIIRALLGSKDGISFEQLDDIRTCVDHFDETIEFFVCNLLFIVSMIQDPKRGQKELDSLYASFRNDVSVLELDFFLSALFMSCYVLNPKDRTPYLIRFERITADYETLLFSSAADGRTSSRQRFSDRFDLEFEDGFNALTNYTYTAPSINYMDANLQKQSVDVYLSKYWELLSTLEDAGNYEKMLRLLQAISQMIVNWPEEGFEALCKFVDIKHPIVHRGLIRVLAQNYLRYPKITRRFLKNNEVHFTSQDLLEIYGNTDSNIEYRTLEQLQWARILYFLRTWLDSNGIEKLLSVFLSADTLEKALEEIISVLPHSNNDELGSQIDPIPLL